MTRSGTAPSCTLAPELAAGLLITLAAWLGMGAVLRGRGARRAFTTGFVLAVISSGAVTFHVVASDYLTIAAQPASYRCGLYTGSGDQLPAWATVLEIVAFPAVLCMLALGSRSTTEPGAA